MSVESYFDWTERQAEEQRRSEATERGDRAASIEFMTPEQFRAYQQRMEEKDESDN